MIPKTFAEPISNKKLDLFTSNLALNDIGLKCPSLVAGNNAGSEFLEEFHTL
jgi:hypothetical protein